MADETKTLADLNKARALLREALALASDELLYVSDGFHDEMSARYYKLSAAAEDLLG